MALGGILGNFSALWIVVVIFTGHVSFLMDHSTAIIKALNDT